MLFFFFLCIETNSFAILSFIVYVQISHILKNYKSINYFILDSIFTDYCVI